MRSGCYGLAALAALAAAAFAGPPDELVARITAVGKEGAGHAEAAAAWKELVRQGNAALVPILAGMDDDNPRASNWLRTAFDAIAEQSAPAGRLPAAELEKFIADTDRSRAARRLAYEWLCRADPAAPGRLLPGMLHDPSPELRRDAVALATKDAQALLDKGDKTAARAAFKKAFDAACDIDQVDSLSKKLKELGEPADIAGHYRFVRAWYVAASFDNTGGKGFATVYPPEKGVDLAAVYPGKTGEVRWVSLATDDPMGLVDLNVLIGKHKDAVAYAYAVLDAPAGRRVQVRTGCATAVKVFVNGREVFAKDEYHHGMTPDQYVATAHLKPGRNELLLKVCQNNQTESWAQAWRFQVRLTDPAGAAVAWTQVSPEKGAKP